MSTPRHLKCQYPADEAGFFYLRGQVNSALEAAMIVWKYILLFTCLGIGRGSYAATHLKAGTMTGKALPMKQQTK